MESKYPFDYKIIYIHGLYGSGKSRRLYLIAKHDHFHDLCLSLNNIFHSRKSKNYLTCNVIKIRNNKHKLKALPIPLYNPHLTKERLVKYKPTHIPLRTSSLTK